MGNLTKADKALVDNAYRAISYLCECSNHSAPHNWREALRLERKQGLATAEAKANCVKAWLQGATKPTAQASELARIRDGYLKALLLGAGQSETAALFKSDYTGPLYDKALELAIPAAEAWQQAIIR